LFKQEQDRIFVPCKERISHKDYFRFSYVSEGIFPTQDVTAIFLKSDTRESIYYILALLNSEYVFEWLKHKGVVKGNIVEFSEKPLASIPVKRIDWENNTVK
jgi:adenine-specific DNA-methyltransferase